MKSGSLQLRPGALDQKLAEGILADSIITFQRQFYICTGQEMRDRWSSTDDGKIALDILFPRLPTSMQDQIETDFKTHNPLWAFTRDFVYDGTEFDPETLVMVPKSEYYLYPPLHEAVINRIYEYLTTPHPQNVRGLAVFLAREFLKTSAVIEPGVEWVQTRHRILFNDWTGSCVIHDIAEEAENRTGNIRNFFATTSPFRALYPEFAPITNDWMAKSAWDLPGRTGQVRDAQIRAWGAKSVKQGPHYPYHWLDDLESSRHETSAASRDETERFFLLLKYLGKGTQTKRVLAGTFYSPFSIHAQIMESRFDSIAEAIENPDKSGWIVIHIPAIADENTPNERSIFPTRQPLDYLKAMEQEEIQTTGDNLRFRMNKMLDFTTVGKYTFDRERFQVINLESPIPPLQPIVDAIQDSPIIIQADYAGKDDSTRGRGDRNAIWVIAYPTFSGRIYRIHLDLHFDNTSSLDEACTKTLELAQRWGAWYIFAEETAAHRIVGNTLNRISAEMGTRYNCRWERGNQIGNMRTLVPRSEAATAIGKISTYKMARMKGYQLAWNAGLCFLSSEIPADYLDEYKKEVFPFPFIGRDDLLDAASEADDERVSNLIPKPKRAPEREGRLARIGRGQANTDLVRIGRYTGMMVRRGS